jgi:DNA repair photolyase
MKTGTREWSDDSANCMTGTCPHRCRYCYAPEWYKRWGKPFPEVEQFNPKAKAKKYDGVVMFPTRHDITPENLQHTLTFLDELLKLGNSVLVVSKPHFSCVVKMCALCMDYDAKERLEFRFTIGSLNEMDLRYWEPGAPRAEERLRCFEYAKNAGFKVSASMEPLLCRPADALPLVNELLDYCEGSEIWIGAMNNIERRVKIESPVDAAMVKALKEQQTPRAMRALYDCLKSCPEVRWKDSYQKALGLGGPKG